MAAHDGDAALAALAVLADMVAERVLARLTAGARDDQIDQVASPLGKRRHCAAVRRRVARAEPGAAIVGRRHLLSRDALQSELDALSKKPRKARASDAAPAVDELATLRARFGFQKAG